MYEGTCEQIKTIQYVTGKVTGQWDFNQQVQAKRENLKALVKLYET